MDNKVFQNGLWCAKLSDGSIFSHSSLNVLCLREIGNYLVFALVGSDNWFVVRHRITGQEYRTQPNSKAAGYFECATDGRYIAICFALSHGKHTSLPGELLYAAFDTINPGFLDFSARPALDTFHNIGAATPPNFLWIRNGHQVNGLEGNDPGGEVVNHKLVSVNEINWASQEVAGTASAVASSYSKWKRIVTLPSGVMSGIQQFPGTEGFWPVDANKPTEPDWLKL